MVLSSKKRWDNLKELFFFNFHTKNNFWVILLIFLSKKIYVKKLKEDNTILQKKRDGKKIIF